ncbi:MAG: type I methionyl aminopeptidase [Lachnospiraceae bacterium]|nr:type I methionyl aminopeptidase [Lachnospiraceae bacterium]
MAITIKSEREIQLMRDAGKVLADVHEALKELVVPGISTYEIDRKAHELIVKAGCTPSFLNYEGYPASICCSVNEVVVHGIPSKSKILKEGDIISLDAGVIRKGYQSDAARTWAVGKVSPEVQKLVEVTEASFFEALKVCRAGHHLNEIGETIENFINPYGYGIVRDLCGHGIGTEMHEEPQIANFKQAVRGMRLRAGMTIAVEPMINLGTWEVDFNREDGWTVTTKDGSRSAHYENTILITDGDPEILSLNN